MTQNMEVLEAAHKALLQALSDALDSVREELAVMMAERDELKMMQCTSPWPDSPPCRGIQTQLDKITILGQERDQLKEELEKKNSTGPSCA